MKNGRLTAMDEERALAHPGSHRFAAHAITGPCHSRDLPVMGGERIEWYA
jgi:hypothetical protein